MPPTTSQRPRQSRLSLGVLLPVTISLVTTAAATLALVLWSAQGVDQRSLEQQTRLARHVIDLELVRVPHEQESVTVWDDSITNLKPVLNTKWVDINLGQWMRDYFGHDEVIIADSGDQPVYTMVDGRQTNLATAGTELETIRPLISQLRRHIAGGALDDYEAGTVAHPPSATDLMTISGVPTVVSVAPIITDSGDYPQARGTEYLHVSMLRLDGDFARQVGDEYLIPGVRFTSTPSVGSGKASVPLSNAAGRFITFFEWDQSTPGQAILSQTLPAIILAFAIAGVIAIVLIDQIRRKSRALEAGRADAAHQAAHDTLTGLPNRVSFEAALTRILAQHPSPDRRVSLLALDLDRFKKINDTLGHRAGDDLLEAVSQRLVELSRPGDTLARLDGDEFGIIHIHAANPGEPVQFAQRVIEALGKPFVIVGGETFVGVSIGIATAESDEADAHELARRADIALYEAKASGRNRAVVFEEPMNQLLQNRSTIEAELRDSLRQTDQLAVAFQPLFGRNGEITGAEALARWNHPRMGPISPAHFIPVAEASGLIEGLGIFVLREACRLGAKWPGRIVAVNISPVQLRNPRFPKTVFNLLAETGMRPSDLELEITEGILLEEASDAADALRVFRSAGIQIALDDFGTGYSSLNYLKRYPVDRIKIDRSFVSQLGLGSVSIAIVQAMVTLAHALKIDVTAEGVETREQLSVLTDLGCNTFQGFLLSPPLTPAALETALRASPSPTDVSAERVAQA